MAEDSRPNFEASCSCLDEDGARRDFQLFKSAFVVGAHKKESITSELCRKLSRARDPPERLASARAGIFEILMWETWNAYHTASRTQKPLLHRMIHSKRRKHYIVVKESMKKKSSNFSWQSRYATGDKAVRARAQLLRNFARFPSRKLCTRFERVWRWIASSSRKHYNSKMLKEAASRGARTN